MLKKIKEELKKEMDNEKPAKKNSKQKTTKKEGIKTDKPSDIISLDDEDYGDF